MARRHPVDKSDLERWRTMSAAVVLAALSDYAKKDQDYRPVRDSASTRWHVTAHGAELEIVCTGAKFFDTRGGIGGGGAVDLAIHLFGVNFKQAIVMMRSKGL